MKRYVKRCMGLALVLVCLISATQVSAFANEITPRYVGISLIAADLDISTSGRASCYGYANVLSGYSADLTVSLQRDGKTIKSWSDSGEDEVEIILVNMPEAQQDFAYKYNSVNDKITVEVIDDVTTRPDLTDEYGISANTYAIIVKSGEKNKILYSSDLYTYDYTTYQQKDITEEALTNAILDVTTDEKPVIYFLTGHNKYPIELFYSFTQDLADEAYEINELDLLTTGEVPEDCSTLMITSLAEDITEAERDALLDYVNKGGNIILFSDPNTTGKEMPNFQDVLDEYGVSISEGVMLEQDSSKMLYGTPSAILVTVSPYTSVTQETNMNMNACFMTTGRIDVADSEELEELGVEIETLATTSTESFYRTDYSLESNSKTEDDEDSPSATVGALVKKTIDEETTSELIVYSNNNLSLLPCAFTTGFFTPKNNAPPYDL